MLIVVAGKGGVGKTLVSSLLVRCIAELKRDAKILAIDEDPASNFADALGIKPLTNIGVIIDEFKPKEGVSFSDYLNRRVYENTVHTKKFDFIEMGEGQGEGCYCTVNDALRFVLEKRQEEYDFIVVDSEAGLEHLSRKTTTGTDALLIVTDLCEAGFRSAKEIKEIALGANVEEDDVFLIINKVKGKEDSKILDERIKDTGIVELCRIPYDEIVAEYNANAIPLIDLPIYSKAYQKVKELAKFLVG